MGKWRTLKSKIIFRNRWLLLQENKVIAPNGNPAVYTIVQTPPFVVIVALKGDKILMVKQHRFTLDRTTLEFPAGGIEEGESPLMAAKRELSEETGFQASRWTKMGELDDAIGIARHRAHVFVAENISLREIKASSEEEVIESQMWLKPDEIKQKVEAGLITDTKTIAILYKTLILLDSR